MTRIEAYESLFGKENAKTASQEAINILKGNPRPTRDEQGQLDEKTLDAVLDFLDNPVFQASQAKGQAKPLLTAWADELTAVRPASTTVPDPAPLSSAGAPGPRPAPATSKAAPVILNPMASLHGGGAPDASGSSTSSSAAGGGGSGGPTVIPHPGATREESRREREESRERRDDRGDRGDGKGKKDDRRDDRDDRREPPPPPKKPGTVVAIVRERIILADRTWPTLRDAIINAWRTRDHAKLEVVRQIMNRKLEGQHGPDGRLFGAAMRALFQDLSAGLHTSDPAEFRHRFWG